MYMSFIITKDRCNMRKHTQTGHTVFCVFAEFTKIFTIKKKTISD